MSTLPQSKSVIEAIHRSRMRSVLAVTGGGQTALADLLTVPGGSRSVLEACIPYSAQALQSFLGHPPDRSCSSATALAMAACAFQRATRLAACDVHSANKRHESPATSLTGLGCTAALQTSRLRRGTDRCFVAFHQSHRTGLFSLEFDKTGTRDAEELTCSLLVLHGLRTATLPDDAVGPDEAVPIDQLLLQARDGDGDEVGRFADLGGAKPVERSIVPADPLIAEVTDGRRSHCWFVEGKSSAAPPPVAAGPIAILSGSFNPLHAGHLELHRAAAAHLNRPVVFEMPLVNAAKPPIDFISLNERLEQFAQRTPDVPVILTGAATFAEKSLLFPESVFVVGADTAVRIAEPQFYENATAMQAAFDTIAARRCRFLVACRVAGDTLQTCRTLGVPETLQRLFDELPVEKFRSDLSSTDLRRVSDEPTERNA